MFDTTLALTETEDAKADVGFLRADDTWIEEAPALKPGDLVRNRRTLLSTDGAKPPGTLWRIVEWVPDDNPAGCFSLYLVGQEHKPGGGPSTYRVPGADLDLATPLEATEAALAIMATAAADFAIDSILAERSKAERAACERALARIEASLERQAAARERHWTSRLARWWARLRGGAQ